MILKTKEGHYVELTEKEYRQFVVEIMVHFETDKKLELYFHKDGRVNSAELIFATIAREGAQMSAEMKQGYLSTARELLESYNQDCQKRNNQP